MSIDKKVKKIKSQLANNEKYIFLVLVIVVVSLLSFGLGRLYQIETSREPLRIEWYDLDEYSQAEVPLFLKNNEATGEGSEIKLVASKNGGRYHYPWCPSAKAINPENLIDFSSKEEARAAGYTPAANCPGLE